ncbi:MAG: GNAT family N-acetyltransferase [Isosphaeraceae bacterium]
MRRWWVNIGTPLERSSEEGDHAWNWAQFLEDASRDPFPRSYGALTVSAGRLEAEGAVNYRLNARSLLEPGRGAVYLRYVASAPRNRYRLVGDNAVYRGVGEALVAIAILESVSVGLEGRVLGDPLRPAIPFYEGMGFQKAMDPEDRHVYYEITKEHALALLEKRGFV